MTISLDELLAKKSEIDEQIAKLRQDERNAVIVDIKRLIKNYGLTYEALFGSDSDTDVSASRKRSPAKVKFIGPGNDQSWTGRGRTPRWLMNLMNQGHTKEEYAVK